MEVVRIICGVLIIVVFLALCIAFAFETDLIVKNKTYIDYRKENKHAWFMIGETLVDESKGHISAEEAINKIREYMRDIRM